MVLTSRLLDTIKRNHSGHIGVRGYLRRASNNFLLAKDERRNHTFLASEVKSQYCLVVSQTEGNVAVDLRISAPKQGLIFLGVEAILKANANLKIVTLNLHLFYTTILKSAFFS